MAVRGVRSNPDTPQRWDSYAQDLSSKYIAASQWVEMDLLLSKMETTTALFRLRTLPPDGLSKHKCPEAGLKEYIDDITTWAEDYLRPEGCYLDLEELARVAMRM